jgi:hypothetical protein
LREGGLIVNDWNAVVGIVEVFEVKLFVCTPEVAIGLAEVSSGLELSAEVEIISVDVAEPSLVEDPAADVSLESVPAGAVAVI